MRKPKLSEGIILVVLFGASIVSAPAEDYGLDVLVYLGAPGCEQPYDGGQIQVSNTNVGVTLDVSWHGFTTDPSATPNVVFTSTQGTCLGGDCAGSNCPSDPGECDHPSLNPTPDNVCTECLCELADTQIVLEPLEDNGGDNAQGCNYPVGCSGSTCDNPPGLCPQDPDFCSELVSGPSGQLGIIVEIHRISFDDPDGPSQCWLSLEDVVLDDLDTIDVNKNTYCPQ